jgi:hypothetical protein
MWIQWLHSEGGAACLTRSIINATAQRFLATTTCETPFDRICYGLEKKTHGHTALDLPRYCMYIIGYRIAYKPRLNRYSTCMNTVLGTQYTLICSSHLKALFTQKPAHHN